MLRSMTGFGKAEKTFDGINVSVEIKSLNGKQLDLNLKMPPILKPYEFEIRSILQQSLLRGSIDISINIVKNGATRPMVINLELAHQYYKSVAVMAQELQLPQNDVLSALLKLPDVVSPSTDELPEAQWEAVRSILDEALSAINGHRIDEGASLEKDLLLRITNIETYQEKVKEQEPLRKEKIRQRLESALKEWMQNEAVDKNRMEQELIYYIEKLDISEEQVRLANHCRYFKEVLKEKEIPRGKKLNFILQEIGREINTTGAKANDADIQRWVIKMKDELEKAKEQILNVL